MDALLRTNAGLKADISKAALRSPNENRWDLKLHTPSLATRKNIGSACVLAGSLLTTTTPSSLVPNGAIRALIRRCHHQPAKGPLSSRVFAASVVVPLASGISHHQQGNDLYGIYGRSAL